ncbi:MAG: DinB family protein [Acidobacteria bacterium]|nr:DinB family protein [Acidobacteriota bacterium]MBI3262204.1 DinB family protein [Acidobacteriota bacterium]
MIDRPKDTEYAPFFAGYVSLVPEADIVDVLQKQIVDVGSQARTVPANGETFAYAPGKWNIREVYGHMADAERIFGYRAVCISRGERASLPGFDEKQYVARSRFADTRLTDLVREFTLLREANLVALQRLDRSTWSQMGTANGHPISVRALAFIMAGHVRHHLRILGERYAVPAGV